MTPGAGPFLTQGAQLARFIKRTTTHCFIQNMKALGLVDSEKIFFYVFPIVSLGELSIAMETNLAQNLIQPFPLLNDALDKFGLDWPCCLRDI